MKRMLLAMLLALACCGAAAKGRKAHFYYPRLEGTYVMVKSIPPAVTDDAEISRTPGRKEPIMKCCSIRHFLI